jgi:nicotinamidase-related amidase
MLLDDDSRKTLEIERCLQGRLRLAQTRHHGCKKVEVIVLTGIHLDWCIEGNARLARDNGYLPIVIGDACGCQKPEQEKAAMERINNFFAPVISSETFVKLLKQST